MDMLPSAAAAGAVALAGFFGMAPTLPAQGIDPDDVDEAIETLRTEFGVPGVAVVVVKGDSIVQARGYGVREIDGEARMDEHTTFAIGSATKAFTATLLGSLVDEGALGWDDRVIDRLPGFQLHDPATTAHITVRDLLAHRSGLPPANLMWLTSATTEVDTLLHRLRRLEPLTEFRSAFTYQNLLYVAAGRIAEEVSGTGWDALLTERILQPLGMSRTTPGLEGQRDRSNVATPHALENGVARPVPYRQLDHVGPAGSMHSSASDLGRWLRFLLAEGVWEGERLIDETTLTETMSPQMIVRADPVMAAFHPAAHVQTYGMGWFVSDFHGMTLLAHGGGIDGMSALVALVPEAELGVAILTNLQTPTPPTWIFGMLYALLDPALEVEPTDWRTPAATLDEMFAGLMGRGTEPTRVSDTRPSHTLDAYTGRWDSPTLGEATIAREHGGLTFRYGSLTGALEHWHFDTFRVRWAEPAWRAAAGPGWITFHLDRTGTPAALELVAIPGESERLERVGD